MDDTASPSPNPIPSCIHCRRLKRKCDRKQPSCSLCAKTRRRCTYPAHAHTTSPTHPPRTQGIQSRSQQSPQTIAAPASYDFHDLPTAHNAELSAGVPPDRQRSVTRLAAHFLDSVATRGSDTAPSTVRWADVDPSNPSDPGISVAFARQIIDIHRNGAHEWLPVVCLKRVIRRLNNNVGNNVADADESAMFYAIYLLNSRPTIANAKLLPGVRAAVDACEIAGRLTMALLITEVVLAYFEVGQGLFPQAYASASRAATLCSSLGLHDKRNATQLLPKAETWSEVEERRRLWWAVVILDRWIHTGLRFRPLFVHNISAGEILPAFDLSWDQGMMSVNPLLVMSIESRAAVDRFARLCQAAHLLGKVCSHGNEHPIARDVDLHFSEAIQLRSTISSLLRLLNDEDPTTTPSGRVDVLLSTARAMCYSGLLLLCDIHSTVEIEETQVLGGDRALRIEAQQMAIEGYREVIPRVTEIAEYLEQSWQEERFPPFLLLQSFYAAATSYAWFYRESDDQYDLDRLQDLRNAMRRFSERWQVADVYLQLLENTEHSYVGGCGM